MTVLAGSGISTHAHAYEAGRSAALAALAPLQQYSPGLVVVFTTDHYDQADVVRGVRSLTGAAELIGCCSGGLITAQGVFAAGVAVMALYADDLEVTTAIADGLSTRPSLAAEQVAEQLENRIPLPGSGKQSTALILTDGLTGALTMDTALQTTAAVLGPLCPLVGGAAGDSLKYERTSLFVNESIQSDAIALALISSAAPVGVGVRHGWTPIGRHLVITRSAANIIYELDGRPPIEVYQELFPQQTITSENFREITRYHPIGFPQASGEFLVRLPLHANPDGSIACVGMLPENAVAYIMQGNPQSLLNAARTAAHCATEGLQGYPVAAAIIIDCVTRPPLLGDEMATEIMHIRDVLGHDTPIIGMYSFGEFAADDGPVAFHNKTVVVWAIGKTEELMGKRYD